jgi:hypothetical protein
MNNPDEKTAAEQFGTTDKYFGVCTMMVTLPGLPMIGHGQIEGYREKYGMEYRHAKWDEAIDDGLVHGHEWRIFPLTHRRTLFANVEDFYLYDFYTSHTTVNEDVFAYSNRIGNERGLVVYHNKYARTSGWIKTSAASMDKASGKLVQKTLAEGLGIPKEPYAIFKDYVTGLEYIRSCRELVEKGLFVELGEYQCHVFLDWQFITGEQWKVVNDSLNGAGVASIYGKFDELFSPKVEEVKPKIKKAKKISREIRSTKKKKVKASGQPSGKKKALKEKI